MDVAPTNTASASELTSLRDRVEQMPKFNQVEVLRILHRHQIAVSENKNGVHVNLTELPGAVLDELAMYLRYVEDQERYLNLAEQKQAQCKSELMLQKTA